jgi:hypothetical protein
MVSMFGGHGSDVCFLWKDKNNMSEKMGGGAILVGLSLETLIYKYNNSNSLTDLFKMP